MNFTSKRIHGMMSRILSSIEDTIENNLEDVKESESFELSGEDILLIRNSILDAGNDTIRSLQKQGPSPDKIRFEKYTWPIYKHAILDWFEDEEGLLSPMITMQGEFNAINEIRDRIGVGIVYNEDSRAYYTCIGLEEIVDNVIPYLDKARLTRIIVGNGQYASWRQRIVSVYKGEE